MNRGKYAMLLPMSNILQLQKILQKLLQKHHYLSGKFDGLLLSHMIAHIANLELGLLALELTK